MTELIAEIGQAHDGSLGMLHAYIDLLADCGVDTVKFQMHIAEAESSMQEPFRIKFSKQDKTRFDYWQRMTFSFEQWKEIKSHTEEKGMLFLCSPFSMKAFEWLEKLEVSRYKVASGELNNYLLLDAISQTKKKTIISSGMSSFEEIASAIERFKKSQVELMQCTTAYPTPPELTGLNVISELKRRFDIPVGLSDHSGEIYAGLAAASMEAAHLEFHVAFHKMQFGPDTTSSLIPSQIIQLVNGVKSINKMLANPVNKNEFAAHSTDLKNMFDKTLAWRGDYSEGTIISSAMLECKKPGGQGVSAKEYEDIIGKRIVVRKVNENNFVKYDDYE